MKNNLYRGALSTIILKLLKDNEQMYGYEIMQKVKEISKGEMTITEGALYPALHKLEADGHLSVSFQKEKNRLRKYYSLTPDGKAQSKKQVEELSNFFKNMITLLDLKTKPA